MRTIVQASCCIALACCTWLATTLVTQSQTMLDLVDQLPPYLLSAKLLNNGHFSITTNYTGTSKTLIYREDGSGNRPVNYTSHIHVKVDDVVYQLPFEVDRTTDLPPPPNPLKVLRLYRDTVQRRPRINAQMLALAPNADSVRVTFTMEPVARPSGAFIRMSVALENAGFTPHNVGVLMLVDTKIGNNDRAPIGTAFGYSGIESEYRQNTPPGLPEFWIAIEGTPLAPGLTARGNLRATDLIEPDRFLFGNWVDDNSSGIPGLYKVLWDERTPSGLTFTDSAILLLWEQQQLGARARRLHASTEIGLVDSLVVSFGTGNGGGGGGGGGGSLGVAGPGSCLTVATAKEDTCGKVGYKPYQPDTIAGLYLVTNTGKTVINGLDLVFESVPLGLTPVFPSISVVPATLVPDQTGVTVLPIVARPRLQATTYAVPIAFIDAFPDTILRDTVCITVPGIQASIKGKKTVTLPVCPGNRDTFRIPIELKGIRCLPVYQAAVVGPPAAPAKVVSPLPTLPADGTGSLLIESAPLAEGSTDVQVRVVVRDWESLVDGDTTWVELIDTVTVTIVGKHAEVQALLAGDTLVLPTICVRDTIADSVQVQNVGGCEATLTTVTLSNNAGGVFSIDPRTPIPQTIARAERGQVFIRASSAVPGIFIGEIEITSVAKPGVLHVPVKVVVDKPGYTVQADTLFLDTVCPNVITTKVFGLSNNTGCDVRIDSVRQTGLDSITISPPNGFVVGSRSNVSLAVSLSPSFEGPFLTTFRVYSSDGGDRDIVVVGWSASRTAQVPAISNTGRARVGTVTTVSAADIVVANTGSQPITVNGVALSGANASEFSALPIVFPVIIPVGGTLSISIAVNPKAIGDRRAIATITFAQDLCMPVSVVALRAYGVQPLLDVERHDVQSGAVCIGSTADTTMVLRNLGNETLHISSVTCAGGLQPILAQPLPITLDSAELITIPVAINVGGIGHQSCECTFETDADWFTEADTTVRMGVTGIVCATVWADTINGYVGMQSPVTVRFEPDERTSFTSTQLATAINDYGSNTVLHLATDYAVARLGTTVNGMLRGAAATSDASGTVITAIGIPEPQANVLASVDADLLLGNSNRSVVRVLVDSMAGGLTDLRIHNGLIHSEYCAYDQRRVQVAAGTTIGVRGVQNAVGVSAFSDTDVEVTWFTTLGSILSVSTHHVGAGRYIELPMPSGEYALLFASVCVKGSANQTTVQVLR